jgi:glycosyltransferase involved in cell wall biosynthesis
MLSSLCEQTDSRNIVVDIGHMPGNGGPSTESIVEFYGSDLQIKDSVWKDYSEFEKRGCVRNRQLKECLTEWLLFADCDMVYHPEYFERLAEELKDRHLNATYMLSSGRVSTSKEQTNPLVDATIFLEPVKIRDAFMRGRALPHARRRNVGAGFSQLINVRSAPHDGYYVNPEKNPDWAWSKRHHKTRSDLHFRRRVAVRGGPRRSLPDWFSDNLVHLNHDRDKEVGIHLETQR